MKKIWVLICFCILICGCGNATDKVNVVKVTKDEALSYIEDGALLIDVRSKEEYEANHIDGAININVEDILTMDLVLVYNNHEIGYNKEIIVYCRSGSRSNTAAEKLIELGYTRVYDLGTIDNWS